MCDHSHCGHEHSHEDEAELGVQYSLYQKINLDQVTCYNEEVEGSGKLVFKPWDKRLDRTEFVSSDVDPELLLNIPFSGNVKLKGIRLIGGAGENHPRTMRLFKDRPMMTLDDVSCTPDQEFELTIDEHAEIEYPIRAVKFSNIHHLSIHLPTNYGAETSTLFYIGLRGEFTTANRDQIVIATYEARPMAKDHKGEIPEAARSNVM